MPTRTGKPRWSQSTVWAIVRNPAYTGQAASGRRRVTGAPAKPMRLSRQRGRHSGGEWFPDTAFLVVHAKSSAELTVEEVGLRCRIFQVDGGHSCDEALADLRLAARCLCRGGAIVIDDAFHAAWPGVTEAILTFLREREDDRFTPLVLGFNKLVLVRAGEQALYRRLLDDPAVRHVYVPSPPYELKKVTVAGGEVYVFYLPTYRRRAASLYRWYFQRDDQVPSVDGRDRETSAQGCRPSDLTVPYG